MQEWIQSVMVGKVYRRRHYPSWWGRYSRMEIVCYVGEVKQEETLSIMVGKVYRRRHSSSWWERNRRGVHSPYGMKGVQGGTQSIMVGKYTREGIVYHGVEGIQAGAGDKCSHYIHSQMEVGTDIRPDLHKWTNFSRKTSPSNVTQSSQIVPQAGNSCSKTGDCGGTCEIQTTASTRHTGLGNFNTYSHWRTHAQKFQDLA